MIQKTKYTHLFSPLKIKRLTVKNRIVYAPLGFGANENTTGCFDRVDEDYFAARAKGGAGLIFTGATLTDLVVDKFLPGTLGTKNVLYNPRLFKLTATRLVERVHAYGTKIFLQLTLGLGRNASKKAPSEIPTYDNPKLKCPELTVEEIQSKIEQFVKAAVIAKECGFDGIEVHAIHFGYLLDEFEMELTNHRTDQYGGCFENRMRATKEILEGVKEKCGVNYPVSIRLGMKTYMKGFNQASLHGDNEVGRTIEESVKVAKYLEAIGYDMISVDVGTYDSAYYCYPPMYLPMGLNVEMAAKIKNEVNIPIIVCGRMHSPELCEDVVAKNQADAVAVGRAMLADPEFAIKAKLNRADDIRPCLSCNFGCRRRMKGGIGIGCTVNPVVRREGSFTLTPTLEPRNIMVIGAGIAGMEVARAASLRGHHVTIYEKSDRIGGLFNIAAIPNFKEEDKKLIAWYGRQLEKQGVKIKFNCKVDLNFILAEGPDVVISATGSTPITPNVDGLDNPKAVGFIDAMEDNARIGKNVVVVGGGLVGCEVALNFAQKGHNVKIVEFFNDILCSGAPTPSMNKQLLEDMFEDLGVEVKTSSVLTAITDEGAIIKTNTGLMTIPADTVILAVGMKSNPSIVSELEKYSIEAYSIGDEQKVGNIFNAISNGYEIGRII